MYTPLRFYAPAKNNEYRPGEDQTNDDPAPFSYLSYALIWKNAHGRELWSMQDLKNIEKATFKCRYDKNINKQCFVQKLDDSKKLWEIESIDDINNEHKMMEITVKRAVRS